MRGFFSRSIKFPNLQIFTASPASSRSAIAAITLSTSSAASLPGHPTSFWMVSLRTRPASPSPWVSPLPAQGNRAAAPIKPRAARRCRQHAGRPPRARGPDGAGSQNYLPFDPHCLPFAALRILYSSRASMFHGDFRDHDIRLQHQVMSPAAECRYQCRGISPDYSVRRGKAPSLPLIAPDVAAEAVRAWVEETSRVNRGLTC